MELDFVELWKKITNIVIRRTNKRWPTVPAFLVYYDTDTLCINPDFAKWFKKNNINDDELIWTAIITHEELHHILIEFENDDPNANYDLVDKVAPNVYQSIFFVDGDWNWLKLR